jgi:TolB-like protein/tRNA A-37 threonylcarbamoyl transferase component Bud32/Flp pilus assembly protein TadD
MAVEGAPQPSQALQEALAGKYVLERELGGGGMSRVYLAHDVGLERRVVVKVLSSELLTGLSRERFRRETLVSARLQHPNIVPVLDAGQAGGEPYFVMAYVEGEPLSARLDREGRLPNAEAVRIMRDVARALAYAHAQGVVHRDIKPGNVLLTSGAAVVADFGIAKALAAGLHTSGDDHGTLTRVGMSVGTPAYMAPEQAAGDPRTDHRADLYSFGLMSYEMLTGLNPMARGTPAETLAAHLTFTPDPVQTRRAAVSGSLGSLVMRCLEKSPNNRPQSAAEVADALEDPTMVSGVEVATSDVQAAVQGKRRRRALLAAAALIGAAAVGFAIWRISPNGPSTKATAAVPTAPAIAVLPFATISSDSSDAFLAAGMTDQLTFALARVPGWRVASRRAVEQSQNSDTSNAGFAKSLGLTHVVEGAVQRQGKRIRIAVRLVDGSTGFSVWSDVFEYATADLFAVQDEIAGRIAEAISGTIGGPTAAAAGAAAPVAQVQQTDSALKPEAYEHYLRARFLFARRDSASLREALDEFRSATRIDSTFARAYAGTASVYGVLPLYAKIPRAMVQDSGLRAAERAIALDSTLADGYTARGVLHNAAWNWPAGEADFRRAIALDSTSAGAYQWLGDNLIVNGRVAEAVGFYRSAVKIDPVTPILRGSYAYALAANGEADSALAQGREAVRLDPGNPIVRVLVGHAYLALGRLALARRELETANSQLPNVPLILGGLGATLASTSKERAQELLTSLAKFRRGSGAPSAIAKIRLALGDVSGAVVALQNAVLEHDEMIGSESMITPLYDPIRSLPQFVEILRAARLDVARLTAKRPS